MGHNSNTFGKDQKKARSLKQGKTPKVGALPVQKTAAHETRFNIQSSINHLMARNTTLFGPAGRKFYNPLSKMFEGGEDPNKPSTSVPSPPPVQMSYDDYIDKYLAQYEQLKAEEDRVNALRGKVIPTAQMFAASKNPQQFLRGAGTEGNFCNAYTQQCYNTAGLTTAKDLIVNGKLIPAGSPMPMIPGNLQHEGVINEEGFVEIPLSEAQPGDNIKKQYYAPSLPWQEAAKPGTKPRWLSGHSMIYAGKEGDKYKVYNSPGPRNQYEDRYFGASDWNSSVSNPQYTGNPTEIHRMKAFRYVGNMPQYQQALEEAEQKLKGLPMPTMQPRQAQLPQAQEPELIYPSNYLQNMATKKYGGDSGAPHNGQPTAAQFFNFGPVPQGPVGFYMHGGINLPEAFPQQPTPDVFFSGAPWQYAQGGQPCYECGGGYMQMGGTNQYGGVNDGSMDVFAEGGNWIQKATAGIKERGTEGRCSGSKFGGPDCPPGSKQYNLAKTFRSMAKKAYGGTADGEDQDDYTGNRAKQFSNVLRMNYGMAEADNQAMRLQDELDNTMYPMAFNGMIVDPSMVNQNNMQNYAMAQGMLDDMDDKQGYNQNQMFGAINNLAADMSNPANTYVKWKFKKHQYGGDLPQAKWGDNLGPDAGNLFAKGRPFIPAPPSSRTNQDPYAGLNDAQILRKKIEAQYPIQGQNYPRQPNLPYLRDYWTSQNGQTNYDYNTPGGYDNIYQRGNRASWNTPGWNTPNPFFNQMYGDPNLTTRMSDYKAKENMFGRKKIKMHFDTYRSGQAPYNQSQTQVNSGSNQNPRANREAKDNTKNVNINAAAAARNVGTNANQPVTTLPNTDIVNYFGQGTIPQSEPSKKTLSPFLQAQLKAGQTMPPTGAQRKELFMSNKFANDQNAQNALFQTEPAPFYNNNNASLFAPTANFGYGGYYSLPMAKWGDNLGPAWGTPQGGNTTVPQGTSITDRDDAGVDRNYARGMQGADPEEKTGKFSLFGKEKTKLDGYTKYALGMGSAALAENLFNAPQRNAMETDMMSRTRADQVYNPNEVAYRGNVLETGAGTGTQMTKHGGYIYANGGSYETGVPLDLTDEEVEAIMAAGGTVRYI